MNSLFTVFDRIDNIIDSADMVRKSYYFWSLPRQSGVTTYLINRANRAASYGKKVLFVTKRLVKYPNLSPKVKIITSHLITHDDATRGVDYDLILINDVEPPVVQHENYLIKALLPSVGSGKIIWINSTEG